MKIFISWSGKLSKDVGSLLKKYLPVILNDAEVFMSAHDIESGSRWSEKLAFELEQSNYGIVCFSPENLQAPWLLFEAGAISKIGGASVCGILLSSLKQTDVSGPLSQFQNRRFTKGDIYQLISDINSKQKIQKDKEQLQILFDAIWPKISEEYKNHIEINKISSTSYNERPERELLEELLIRVRSLEEMSYTNKEESVANLNLTDVLELPINTRSLSIYSTLKFPDLPISNSWQSRFMEDLDPNRYQYIRDIDLVLKQASRAVEEFSRKNPRLFRHSTDYLTKALGFVDIEFRKRHTWATVTLNAFTEYSDLINDS